jgi:mannose-6-phosphate isomerase
MPDLSASEILGAIFQDNRPWGNFRQFTLNQESTVKILTVDPGQTLSLQQHEKRDELWIVLDPGLRVQVGEDVFEPSAGEEIVIMRGSRHRLSSAGPRGRVLEIAFGLFDENDIIRLEDAYNRS